MHRKSPYTDFKLSVTCVHFAPSRVVSPFSLVASDICRLWVYVRLGRVCVAPLACLCSSFQFNPRSPFHGRTTFVRCRASGRRPLWRFHRSSHRSAYQAISNFVQWAEVRYIDTYISVGRALADISGLVPRHGQHPTKRRRLGVESSLFTVSPQPAIDGPTSGPSSSQSRRLWVYVRLGLVCVARLAFFRSSVWCASAHLYLFLNSALRPLSQPFLWMAPVCTMARR